MIQTLHDNIDELLKEMLINPSNEKKSDHVSDDAFCSGVCSGQCSGFSA